MENTPYLYETLLRVLGQHSNWLDLRHRKTLAWMMVSLICAKTVSLGAWTPFVVSQAQGLDHGVGHPLLLLYDVNAPNGQNSNEFKDLYHYPPSVSLGIF